ncbi:D-hexose-6-phosphate mutarotase [Bifidobacterium goeldii]|nr:D-hexose-6-phosphate mutarotase [Bifidobacterium goeldii]
MDTTFIIRSIRNDAGSASMSDFGAHLITWAPTGQPNVVWQPKAIYLNPARAIRGGVPIIFPWFSKGYENGHTAAKTPKHGPARTTPWHRDDSVPSDSGVRYTLNSSDLAAETLAQLNSGDQPNFHAVFEVTVGGQLDMALTVVNDGEETLTYENALHTYFHVGNVEQVRLQGLAGAHYLDNAQPGLPECVQADEPVTFAGETVDRIYYATNALRLEDPQLHRTIVITPSGNAQTVVWNPGAVAGDALGDVEAGEWRDFVCVEAASCRDRSVVLQPGESHTLRQTIAVEQL